MQLDEKQYTPVHKHWLYINVRDGTMKCFVLALILSPNLKHKTCGEENITLHTSSVGSLMKTWVRIVTILAADAHFSRLLRIWVISHVLIHYMMMVYAVICTVLLPCNPVVIKDVTSPLRPVGHYQVLMVYYNHTPYLAGENHLWSSEPAHLNSVWNSINQKVKGDATLFLCTKHRGCWTKD